MASKLISFRVLDEVVEALQAQALDDESLNLTAQRLLTELLGIPTVNKAVDSTTSVLTQSSVNSQQSVDSLVNSVVNSSVFVSALEERRASLVTAENQRLAEVEERLEALEKPEA